MSKRSYVLILVILIAGLTLAACERSASVSPVATATTSGDIPFPVVTQSQIMKDILAATQTAEAMSGTITTSSLPGVATSTPAFMYTTATPSSGMLVTPGTAATSTPLPTATPTAIAYATATPGIPTSYTLQPGEFPYCIARRFNVDPGALLSANGLSTNSQVSPGTVLSIPQNTTWSYGSRALKSHPTSYTVAYGDTVYTIACAFGDADPNIILAANGLSSGSTLTQGQVIQIP
jgi:LysM repeat protein